jgi:hypothetical protein
MICPLDSKGSQVYWNRAGDKLQEVYDCIPFFGKYPAITKISIITLSSFVATSVHSRTLPDTREPSRTLLECPWGSVGVRKGPQGSVGVRKGPQGSARVCKGPQGSPRVREVYKAARMRGGLQGWEGPCTCKPLGNS